MTTPADHSFYYDPEVSEMTFDPECYQLAAHFISDVYQMNDTQKAEQYRRDLAIHIQTKIEEWIVDVISQMPDASP